MSITDPFADVPERTQPDETAQTQIDFRREPSGMLDRETGTPEGWSDGPDRTRNGRPMRPVAGLRGGITQPQYAFIIDLLHDKDLFKSPRFFDTVNAMDSEEFDAYMRDLINRLRETTKVRASELIQTLLELPKRPTQPTPQTNDAPGWVCVDESSREAGERSLYAMRKGDDLLVPRGSYALRRCAATEEWVNEINFFSLWIRDDGSRWSLKRYDSDFLQKLPRRTQYKILEEVAKNPAAAAELYGLETSKCGICHRKLTKDESRARGIGPICAERWGW